MLFAPRSFAQPPEPPGQIEGLDARVVYPMFVLGQSLSNGNQDEQVAFPDPLAPTRVFMPESGIRALGTVQDENYRRTPLREDQIADFVPAHEQRHDGSGETGWSVAGWRAIQPGMLPGQPGVIAATLGIGSIAYRGGCDRGSIPYENLMKLMRRAGAVCQQHGLAFRAPWMFHPWHEAHYMPQGQIVSELLEAQANYTADIMAITGGSAPVRLVTDASASHGNYSFRAKQAYGPRVSLAVLDVAVRFPDRFLYACPRYFLDHVDDQVHLTSRGNALRGEYFGRIAARAERGQDTAPLRIVSAVRRGPRLTLKYARWRDAGPLRFNTETVTKPTAHGFVARSGDNPLAIVEASMRWTGPETLQMDLAQTPGPGPLTVAYATEPNGDRTGPKEGPRGTVSDSFAMISKLGKPMPNYAAPQEVLIP